MYLRNNKHTHMFIIAFFDSIIMFFGCNLFVACGVTASSGRLSNS